MMNFTSGQTKESDGGNRFHLDAIDQTFGKGEEMVFGGLEVVSSVQMVKETLFCIMKG